MEIIRLDEASMLAIKGRKRSGHGLLGIATPFNHILKIQKAWTQGFNLLRQAVIQFKKLINNAMSFFN